MTWLRAQLDERESTAAHNLASIERHDLAVQMLVEVDAKRRILDLHRQDGALCEHCDAHWPCPTVRLVGLPYADRDGYREEWRP